ncbi:MAG: hypothetical protein JWO94_1507 [Verrucomicrobiaceae bacterium]|nr:hypothetical protein [Verrucomicrobiaceae bacterium]
MKTLLLTLLGLGLTTGLSLQAQPEQDAPSANSTLSPDQLNELLGPIALYPDPLISLILPASTVPSDIVLADRFIASGGNADNLDDQPWDPSVKGLARYPETLKWLDDNLDWTTQVGDAFSGQPTGVMDAIQGLRAKAKSMGNLADTSEEKVVQDEDSIRVVPAQPDAIYVPSYDPEVVYAQQAPAEPFVYFSQPYAVGPWLGYDCDWHHHHLYRGDWSRGWDYHRDYDRGSHVFINNNIRNSQVWHINAQRRQMESRRRSQQNGVATRPVLNIRHPQHSDFARHQGETIRRAELPVEGHSSHAGLPSESHQLSEFRHSADRHFDEGGRGGHFALPHTQAPNLSHGAQNEARIMREPGSRPAQVELRRPTPQVDARIHENLGHASPMAESHPQPHAQVRHAMPHPIAQPHTQGRQSMPRPIARPHAQSHSQGRRSAPKARTQPHAQAQSHNKPSVQNHHSKGKDTEKKHK